MLSTEGNMRSIEPKAELPLVHVPLANAMPTRPPRGPTKNLTGIYLGTESRHAPQGVKHAVPPLARGRGMPSHRVRTPTEQRRYDKTRPRSSCQPPVDPSYSDPALTAPLSTDSPPPPPGGTTTTTAAAEKVVYFFPVAAHHHPLHNPNIPHLPPMPLSRYPLVAPQRKVELLRIKEEKRGFSGNPLRRKQPSQVVPEPDEPRTFRGNQPEEPNFWDITKQNARNFTSSTNTGVTHFEFLSPEISAEYYEDNLLSYRSQLAREIRDAAMTKEDLSGLVDCYKKICRGNAEALQHLLPQRKVVFSPTPQRRNSGGSTGFTVKSYRNPNQAEIIATFPPPDMRPKTAGTGYSQRPYLPAPYFFKSYQPPKTPGERSLGKDYSPYAESNIASAPGAGVLSRSVSRGRQHNSPRAQTPVSADFRHRRLDSTPLVPTTTPTPLRAHTDFSYQSSASVKEVEVALPKHESVQPEIVKSSTSPNEQNVDEKSGAKQNSEGNAQKESEMTINDSKDAIVAEDSVEPSENQDVEAAAKEADDTTAAEPPLNSGTTESPVNPDTTDTTEAPSTASAPAENGDAQPPPTDGADQPPSADGAQDMEELSDPAPEDSKPADQTPEIKIGLEDEAGEEKPVAIDDSAANEAVGEIAEENQDESKTSEEQLEAMAKSRQDRKQELHELLSEHAELVQQVSDMEVTAPTNDAAGDEISDEPAVV